MKDWVLVGQVVQVSSSLRYSPLPQALHDKPLTRRNPELHVQVEVLALVVGQF